MKIHNFLLLLLLGLSGLISCEKAIFLPRQGAIEGIITNNNGEPMAGVEVSASFEAASPNGQPFHEVKSIRTDRDGYYRLSNLWDEVEVNIVQPGFQPLIHHVDLRKNTQPVVNLVLVGSPTIKNVAFDKTTLQSSDTIVARMEIEDVFNSQPGNYGGNLLLMDMQGAIQSIFPAGAIQESQNRFLLEALITADVMPPGSYQVLVEVFDPDSNLHQISADDRILVP